MKDQPRSWNHCARKVGRKYCLYHFRHTFATRLLQGGVDALTVSTLLGHVDTSTLSKVYAHLTHQPEFLRRALSVATPADA